MRRTSCLILTLLLTLPAGAQVYRWVDEQGRVHYGDKPPTAQQAEKVDVEAGERRPPARQADGTETEPPRYDPAALDDPLARKQCELAKTLLETYQAAGALVETDAEGKRRQLTEEEKAEVIAKAKAEVRAKCTPAHAEREG